MVRKLSPIERIALAEGLASLQQPTPLLKDEFGRQKQLLSEIVGAPDANLERQRDLSQAQALFDVARLGLAFAAPTKEEIAAGRRFSPAERLAQSAQDTKFFESIGARAADLEKAKQAEKATRRAFDLKAFEGATQAVEREKARQAKLRESITKAFTKEQELKFKQEQQKSKELGIGPITGGVEISPGVNVEASRVRDSDGNVTIEILRNKKGLPFVIKRPQAFREFKTSVDAQGNTVLSLITQNNKGELVTQQVLTPEGQPFVTKVGKEEWKKIPVAEGEFVYRKFIGDVRVKNVPDIAVEPNTKILGQNIVRYNPSAKKFEAVYTTPQTKVIHDKESQQLISYNIKDGKIAGVNRMKTGIPPDPNIKTLAEKNTLDRVTFDISKPEQLEDFNKKINSGEWVDSSELPQKKIVVVNGVAGYYENIGEKPVFIEIEGAPKKGEKITYTLLTIAPLPGETKPPKTIYAMQINGGVYRDPVTREPLPTALIRDRSSPIDPAVAFKATQELNRQRKYFGKRQELLKSMLFQALGGERFDNALTFTSIDPNTGAKTGEVSDDVLDNRLKQLKVAGINPAQLLQRSVTIAEAVRQGTGMLNVLKNKVGKFIAAGAELIPFVPDASSLGATQRQAAQYVAAFTTLLRVAIAQSPRFAEGEQQRLAKLLPDIDAFFTTGRIEAGKLFELKTLMQAELLANYKAAATEENASLQNQLASSRYALELALDMMPNVRPRGRGTPAGETQRKRLEKRLKK
tara:strand:+ start:42 stop:2288 length:2247 start_codon:yes stop_codon:yes gene_type:complete